MSPTRTAFSFSCVLALVLAGATGCGDHAPSSSGSGGGAADGGAGSGGSSSVGGGGVGGDSTGVGGSTCAAPTGPGTEHGGSIAADETWTAADSPHLLPYDTTISAKVVIEPCAVVRIGDAKTVKVIGGGRIEANGVAGEPVVIERLDAASPWAAIRVAGGTMDLEYTRVGGGGHPLNAGELPVAGAVMLTSTAGTGVPEGVLRVAHVAIEGSASQGVVMTEFGAFTDDSDDLTITGAAGYPINSWANLAGTIPAGSYTGNGVDQIVFPGNGQFETITQSMTIKNLGVPYRVGYPTSSGELRMGGDQAELATVTIEPGVELRFQKNGGVRVEVFSGEVPASSALVAVGEPDAPIVFTSAEPSPAPGDWGGIWFGLIPDPSSRIEHAVIEFAGAPTGSGSDSCVYPNMPSSHHAAVRIYGPPASQFIENTLISKSAGYGIDRGWRSDEKIDFMPTNQFVEVAKCKQTYPRNDNGTCPDPVPCP